MQTQRRRLSRTLGRLCFCLTLALVGSHVSSVSGQIVLNPENRALPSERLGRYWKTQPEWLAMFLDLSVGGQISVTDGWHRLSPSQIRLDWTSVAKQFDRNGDHKIANAEFGGTEATFGKLDRDHNSVITEEDFVFPRNELARARSKMIMSFADRDRNGRLDPDEYQSARFQATRDNFTLHMYFADSISELDRRLADSTKLGLPFLALGDLQEIIDRNAVRFGQPLPPRPDDEFDAAFPQTLMLAFARGDLGSYGSGPALNATAPDFALKDTKTGEPFSLSQHISKKPVVLIFGCLSLPAFRAEAGNLAKFYHQYKDQAEIRFIYTRECHTVDGWRLKYNDELGLKLTQQTQLKDREAVANYCLNKLGLEIPTLADTLNNHVSHLYSGNPSRLYLIDRAGKVAYKGGRGPFGFKPLELEQSLLLLLHADSVVKPASPTPK